MKAWLHQFDQTVSHNIQAWPAWMHSFFLAVTFIGQPIIPIAICVVLGGVAFGRANTRLFVASGVALATMAVGTMIKTILDRQRPLTEYVASMFFKTSSFPSGHTVGSTVVFGLLAYLAWQNLPEPWNGIVTILLVLLIIAVGVSRIYLGAHFPSDVIGGWLLGAVGLAIIIIIVRPTL